MAGEKSFLRIPPDSTGKRVRMGHTARVNYQGKTATLDSTNYVWTIGEEYNLVGFGVVVLTGVFQANADSGYIDVNYTLDETAGGSTPATGAQIIDLDTSIVVGTVASVLDLYVNATHLVGQNNSNYGAHVDGTGSVNVRFSEGLPQLDAWGKLRVSGATLLGSYVFSDADVLVQDFTSIEIQGGYVNFDANRRSVRIGVDDTSPLFTPGLQARADITSNTYHHYTPGSSHLYMNTVRINDASALNCDRRWGLYDQENGFYFQVNSAAEFSCIIRSSATGAPVDVYIPQSSFNIDRLDGTGATQYILNLENDNIFWIDVQWHGSGRVRFGVYIDGQRLTMHEYYHGNNFQYAMGQTASLPVRYVCLGRPGVASNLYVESWSASVWTETNINFLTLGSIRKYTSTEFAITANVTDTAQRCFAVAPPLSIDGQINRRIYIPTAISAFAYDSVTGVDAIVDLDVVLNAVESGCTFATIPGTYLEICTGGTTLGAGRLISHRTFRGGTSIDMTRAFNNFQYGAIKNFSQDGGTVQNTISAMTNASPAVITTSDFFWNIKEPQSILNEFNTREYGGRYLLSGFTGTTGVNGQLVYVKLISLNTAELYTDEALTIPFNTTAAGAYSGTGGLVDGFAGGRLAVTFMAKTRTAFTTNCVLSISIQWKEISQ